MRLVTLLAGILFAVVAGTHGAAAATVAIDFTGAVEFRDEHGLSSGVSLNQVLSGHAAYEIGSLTISVPQGNQYQATGFARIDHRTYGGHSSGFAQDIRSGGAAISLYGSRSFANGYTEALFSATGDGHPPLLTSLADVPTSFAALKAFLDPNFGATVQVVRVVGAAFYTYRLRLSDLSVQITPIPGALPLFASAIGGLALVAWRRSSAGGAAPR
jgi:hypothetical protein